MPESAEEEPAVPDPISTLLVYFKRFSFSERDNELELVFRCLPEFNDEGWKLTKTKGFQLALFAFNPEDLPDDDRPVSDSDWDTEP